MGVGSCIQPCFSDILGMTERTAVPAFDAIRKPYIRKDNFK